MDATQHFLAFTILTTGGLFKSQAFRQSQLYCHRLVPPVITAAFSPCTFPCVLLLSEVDWKIVSQSERDGTPCRGGLCASGICKPTRSFQEHKRFKQDFLSSVMCHRYGIGCRDTKANRNQISAYNVSSNRGTGERNVVMNTGRKLGVSVNSGPGRRRAEASGTIKHIADGADGLHRTRFIYGDDAISGVRASSGAKAENVDAIEGASRRRRQRRSLQKTHTSLNDSLYKKLLQEIDDDSDEIIPLRTNRGGMENWAGPGNGGGAGVRRIWDRHRYGPTVRSPFDSGHSRHSTGRHRGLGGGRALAMLAAAGLLAGGSSRRGSSAIHGVTVNRGAGTYGGASSRSPSSGRASAGRRSISRGASGIGGSRRGSSSRGSRSRGGSARGAGGRGARG
ncbi:uncharacterized protein LOC142576351 [Dermacentor variabilis]|uniref:uncharacterized protein LOC142576351 n=1 Tax=Dermacentor variabilis TaxID=34621 RepID=UPI003F5CB3F3